ncbi:MAG: hypothetical protein JO316_19950 [Abitibacteriaceae bacterium]|nr:hypothetical protein [Abditibacteriaceae bacterium]MBV9867630.1 hypothetical protein [Abditibacteriaceae bacterium]
MKHLVAQISTGLALAGMITTAMAAPAVVSHVSTTKTVTTTTQNTHHVRHHHALWHRRHRAAVRRMNHVAGVHHDAVKTTKVVKSTPGGTVVKTKTVTKKD